MIERDDTSNSEKHDASTRADVGDVESAGETTAAATLGGDTTDPEPVGAHTRVKVEGDDEAEESDA